MRWMFAVLAVCALARPGHADEASDLAAKALEKINKERAYAAAIDLYEKAYALSKDPKYLLYSGIAARTAGLPHEAVTTYRQYLATHADAVPELVEQIKAEIETIRATSATIIVATSGAPAEITVDGRLGGVASKAQPLELLVTTTHEIVLRARRDGWKDVTHEVPRQGVGGRVEIAIEPEVIRTTAEITIDSVPAGAIVRTGKQSVVARSTITLTPGDYTFVAHLDGYDDASQPVQVLAGFDRTISFELRETPSFLSRHKVGFAIGAAVTVIVVGVILAPTIRDAFAPEQNVIRLD